MVNVGDIATPKRNISFADDTMHFEGEDYEVTPDTLAYYQMNEEDYVFR